MSSSNREPLFGPDSNSRKDSLINFNPALKHDYVAVGFFDAACLIVDSPRFAPDVDIYPVLYLLRHALELQLKIVIWRHDLPTKGESAWPAGRHRLQPLAKLVKDLCPIYGIDPADNDLEHAWWVVSEFHRFDEDSTNFRYRDQPAGVNSLDHTDRISAPRVKDEVDKALTAIGSVEERIQMRQDPDM